MGDPLEHAPIGVVALDANDCVRSLNPRACELLSVTPDDAEGEPLDDVFPRSVDEGVREALAAEPATEGVDRDPRDRPIEEYYPALEHWLAVTVVPDGEGGTVLYVEETTDEHRAERREAELVDDLDRLGLTNELVADVLDALVDASTRSEIATRICDRLGTADRFDFAWVGEREIGSDGIAIRAADGTTDQTLDAIETLLAGDEAIPERRVIDSGSVEVVQPLGADESVPEPIRRAAFADGLQSLLAIPLRYGSSVYGVVGVYASDRAAFSDREASSFATVGEMAGFAINATRQRALLESSTVVELRFDLTGVASPFVESAVEADAALSLEGTVHRGEDLLCYLDVASAAPSTVASALQDREAVSATRIVSTEDAAGSIEAAIAPSTPIGVLDSQGLTLESATFEPGEHRVTVEVPPEEDVRRIADAFVRAFDASVEAKLERQRTDPTAAEVGSALHDRLTEYQERALRTALFAEYFESPRGSTAEEVAEALDITAPTLLYHLRAGQRKLLEEHFDADR
ncbi:PAS/PAC sensor protein [Salinarchaeum sp. Harcht-Bsk1]|uniref:bacterio-opsin activator domain-containing protein n=1 Tax=Salinarchaeum sp. Harcht-Bsk1 TaxID=1333523 RepID=UPI000342469D|nr:bacterio-opsin activator domain-containing protein [Salinarchaeum sp. Harcht-Bsk1]AGN00859.1 PAS/PAC sensor protein [Salinarchaeum sp. Harcht-Bsk1]